MGRPGFQPDDARVRTVRLLGEACAWKSNLCWCNCGEAHGSGPSSFQPPAASLGRPDAGGLGYGAGRRGRRQLGGDKRDRRVAQCPALGSPTRRGAPQPCQSGRGRGSHDAASRRPGPRLKLVPGGAWPRYLLLPQLAQSCCGRAATHDAWPVRRGPRPTSLDSSAGFKTTLSPIGPDSTLAACSLAIRPDLDLASHGSQALILNEEGD
jgi:hypothetical protein